METQSWRFGAAESLLILKGASVSGAEVPAPYARNLEVAAFPNEQQVIDATRRVLYLEG